MKEEIKILIADDHPIFREGLLKILKKERSFKVYDCVSDGETALKFIRSKKPNIAILDISMPGLSGIQISKIIMEEKLSTIPIILTMYDNVDYLNAALEAGVKGYLLKDETTYEILDCIKIILQGGFYVSGEMSGYLTGNKKSDSNKNEILSKLEKLTQAERKILYLLAQNKTSTQIAKELFLSFKTIQNHRVNICHKLDLSGHNKLLLFAIENKSLL